MSAPQYVLCTEIVYVRRGTIELSGLAKTRTDRIVYRRVYFKYYTYYYIAW